MFRNPLRDQSPATLSYVVRLARDYFASGATMFFSAGCQFAWFLILARSLGATNFGALMMILAVCNLASALCGVGAADAMLRQTARDSRNYHTMLGHGLLVIGVTGVVLSTIAVVILWGLLSIQVGVDLDLYVIVLFAITNILLTTFIAYAEHTFLGLGAFQKANIIEAGFSLVRLLTAAVACLWFGVGTLGEWAVWSTGAHLVVLAACIAMVAPLGLPIWNLDRRELLLGFHYCTPRFADALRVNCDRIVLGIVAPASTLANYAIATRMTQVSQLVVNSLNRIVYPRFASRKKFGLHSVRPTAVIYAVSICVIAVSTAATIFMVAPVLPWLLGSSYENVVPYLRVLCWLLVPLAMQTVPYDLLGAFDRHRERATLYNTTSLAGTALTALVIYSWGVPGAFVAIYVVECGLALALWGLLLHLSQPEAADAPAKA